MRKTSFDGSVGENVQTLRKARDMSQAQLADLMTRASDSSIHQQTVLRIEKGERPLKLSEAIALAKIFGVPPTALWRVSEVDSLTGTWLQRVEDLEHRREVARVDFEAVDRAYVEAVRLASAFLHLQEYLEYGNPSAVPDSLEEIAGAADRISDSTPIRDRFRFSDVLREIGVTNDEIESAAQAGDGTAASIARHILKNHTFERQAPE